MQQSVKMVDEVVKQQSQGLPQQIGFIPLRLMTGHDRPLDTGECCG